MKTKSMAKSAVKTALISTVFASSILSASSLVLSNTASATTVTTTYKTTISGKEVSLTNQSLKKGAKYFISTDVLKKLGATVSYNTKTKTLTIKKNSKTTKIKANSQYAYVNGKKYKLSTTMQTINSKRYLPYDIIAKATNYKASVAGSTIKIYKKTTYNYDTSYGSIKALYQGHTYNIKTQAQYDKVIAWAKKLDKDLEKVDLFKVSNYFDIEGEKEVRISDYIDKEMGDYGYIVVDNRCFILGYDYSKPFSDYYNKGKTFDMFLTDKKPKDITLYDNGLSAAESALGSLKKNGVSYSEAVKVWKLAYTSLIAMHSADAKENHKTESLYDYIFNHKGDCDGDAEMYQLIFDMHGYQTRIHRTETHATPEVKIGNHWYGITGDTFSQVKN